MMMRMTMRMTEDDEEDEDDSGHLDDGVALGLGEDALPAGALDVEAEDPHRRHVRPLALDRGGA